MSDVTRAYTFDNYSGILLMLLLVHNVDIVLYRSDLAQMDLKV